MLMNIRMVFIYVRDTRGDAIGADRASISKWDEHLGVEGIEEIGHLMVWKKIRWLSDHHLL